MKDQLVKSVLIYCLSFLCTYHISAQNWINTYDQFETNMVIDIEQFGLFQSVILLNGEQPQIVYINNSGEVLSSFSLSNHFDQVYDLALVGTDIIVVGSISGTFFSTGKALRMNHEGGIIWSREYDDGFLSSVITLESDIFVGGNLQQSGSLSKQILMRLDAEGNIIWEISRQLSSNSHAGRLLYSNGRIFVVGTATSVGVGFSGFYIEEIYPNSGYHKWRKSYHVGDFDKIFESGYNYPYGACISGNEIVVAYPGNFDGPKSTLYRISVDGDFIDALQLFSFEGTHPHDVKAFENGDLLVVGSFVSSDTITNMVERRDKTGKLLWQTKFDEGTLFRASIKQNQILVGGMKDTYYHEPMTDVPLLASLTKDGELFDSGISICMKKDESGSCDLSQAENIEEEINIYVGEEQVQINSDGKYTLDLPPGVYNLTYDLPSHYSLCNGYSTITVNDSNAYEELTVLVNTKECADLHIGITKTELIRGQSNKVYIEYQNRGNIDVSDAYVILNLDERLILESASMEYEIIDDTSFKFLRDKIAAKENGRIEIQISAEDNINLFTNLQIKAEILPHLNCDQSSDGSILNINSSCEDGSLTFKITNPGADMKKEKIVRLLLNGIIENEFELQLDAEMSETITLETNGQAATLLLLNHGKVVQSETYEACGFYEDGYSSVSFASQYNNGIIFPFIDNSILELRDHHTDARLFQTYNGIGRYHITSNKLRDVTYALRYVNDTEFLLENFQGIIQLPAPALKNSIRIMASSHDIEYEIRNGELVIKSMEEIALNEEFHCKYTLNIDSTIQNNDFISSQLAFAHNGIPIGNENQAYYNISTPQETLDLSPFTQIEDGHIYGKNDAVDFASDLVALSNGDKLAAGVVAENSVGYILTIHKFNKYEQFEWAREYKFHNASPLIKDVEILGNGNIMIVGNLDDKSVYNNYLHDAISFLLVIDSDGKEVHRNRYTLGLGSNIGSTFSGALALDNGNTLIIGYRYLHNSGTHFEMILDPNYEVLSLNHLETAIGNVSYWYSEIVKNIDCIAMTALYTGGVHHESSYVMFRRDGSRFNSTLFDFPTSGGSFAPYYAYVHKDGSLLGSGLYWDHAADDAYRSIIELDKNHDFVRKVEVFTDAYYISPGPVMKHNSNYLVGGSIFFDSTFNEDAFLSEMDTLGNVLWMVGGDFGAREYCEEIFVGDDDRIYATFQTQTIDNNYNLQMGYLYGPLSTVSTDDNTISELSSPLSIYPNPASKQICLDENDQSFKRTQIISMSGKPIMSTPYTGACIDVEMLFPGKYILIVTEDSGIRKFGTFVKI